MAGAVARCSARYAPLGEADVRILLGFSGDGAGDGRALHPRFPNAELGTIELRLTDAGRTDPLFGTLPPVFGGQAGHEDHVVELPDDAVLLASSERVRKQAFRFAGKPIYCTQFHPELDRTAIFERVVAYPEYVERIAAVPADEFLATCRETPEANLLLRTFVALVFGKLDGKRALRTSGGLTQSRRKFL